MNPKPNILFLVAMMGTLIVPFTSKDVFAQGGIASVYSTREGTATASGVRLNDNALTAAHRSLPFGSKVRVTNTKNNQSVVVTITDRGPFVAGRVIDVTPAAARALGFSGLAPVKLDVGERGNKDVAERGNKGDTKVAERRDRKTKRHIRYARNAPHCRGHSSCESRKMTSRPWPRSNGSTWKQAAFSLNYPHR